jgi:hypothetical protein
MQRAAVTLFAFMLCTAVPSGAAPPATILPATAADPAVTRVLDAYQAARPTANELRVFLLDWAGSLKEAKERAAKEKRPIFFVSTTQLEDAGDLRAGHC